jgi:hypothetical protein
MRVCEHISKLAFISTIFRVIWQVFAWATARHALAPAACRGQTVGGVLVKKNDLRVSIIIVRPIGFHFVLLPLPYKDNRPCAYS